jgi:hypothetical protein
MRRAFEIHRDSAGNVPPLPAIFPDQMAPVVRLHAPVEKALTLQRPLPDDMLEIVSEGLRSDPPAEGDRFYTQSA